jgi:DNA-directed RNA polymerase specialized sigma24 family protein
MESAETFGSLLRRTIDGDQQAATLLVRDYGGELHRYVRTRLTDPALRRLLDSLDICQSVLAAFFVHLQAGRFDLTDPRQLMALLQLMAQNKLRDKVRRARAGRRGGSTARRQIEDPSLVPDVRPAPDEQLAGQEIVEAVRNRMDGSERDLLKRWMDGEPWETIATATGGTPEALRKRLSRSIDLAAAQLGLLEDRP